jgi:hypothetical protein
MAVSPSGTSTAPRPGLEAAFTAAELTGLITKDFGPLMPLRLGSTPHVPPAKGQWSQWGPSGSVG